MKRLHVHVSVKDLPASIRFYRTLFGAEPSVTQSDYAKWMLEDPKVIEKSAAQCCVPAQRTAPAAASCCAK
jgi:hypothetical protein